MTNPYLQDQAGAITTQANQNLQNNIMPSLNMGAMATGGFGGSRQGIAQGLAAGQTQQGITSSLAGLYGNAYEQDQNRGVQKYGMDQNYALGNRSADTQQFGAQTARDLGFGNLSLGQTQAANQYALGQGQLGLGQTQAANQLSLGQQQNQNQATANANQYTLGQGQLGLGQQQANNSYSLGQQQNQNQATSTANQYALGQGQLGLGQTQAQNQFSLGQQQNQNQATATANQYSLGQGQLGLGQTQANNSYNLGLGSLGLQGQVADQNFYSNQRGQDLSQYSLGSQMANQGNLGLSNQGQQLYQNGQQEQQAPWQNLQNYGGALGAFSGLNQSHNTPGYSGLQGAIAGGLSVAQLMQLLNKP